jgi:hypothetical protein
MVKSQEQKLKLEAEIEALKKQVKVGARSADSGGLVSSAPVSNNNALVAVTSGQTLKIAEYERFISKYVVNAAAEKARAVAEAEAKMKAKYEALLVQLMEGGANFQRAGVSPETLFDKRNQMVAKSADKGMSRWGQEEIDAARKAISAREEELKNGPGVVVKPAAQPAAPKQAAAPATGGRKSVNFGASLLGK